jgi:hypothetical protein
VYDDALAVSEALVPPDSSPAGGEITEQGGDIHYASTASADDLEAFYLDAIDTLGFKVIDALHEGTTHIEFGRESDSEQIGSVDIVPPPSESEPREVVVFLRDPLALPAD